MNEQTTKLLQSIALKLGTTTEYLWLVLIKQASIDSWVTIIQLVIVLLFGLTLWRVHKKLSSDCSDKSSNYKTTYYEKYDGIEIPMIIGVIVFSLLIICLFFCINSVISGFINPEYWALREILNTINND